MDTNDVLAINQLAALYGHLADEAKFQPVDAASQRRLAEVFTEDAVFDASGVGAGVFSGLDEIRAMFAGDGHPRSHQTTNVYVYADGTDVRVRSKWHVVTDNGKVLVGEYRDVVVRVDDGWRITTRVATF